MPQSDKSTFRRIIESVAVKLIVSGILFGGGLVLTWYTAHSAWFHGLPGYKVGLIVAVMFALCSTGTYFIILTIARIPLRNAPAGSLLEPQENWLREVAEHDRLELHNAVYVTECRVQESLTKDNPHVVFWFYIRNGSVYAISIDSTIKGFIGLWDKQLTGNLTVSSLPHNLQHGWIDQFQIRQELTAKDIAEIEMMDSACEGQGYYDFGNLHIIAKGTSPTTEAMPARLQFRRVLRRQTSNGFELV